jgi:tRNA-Thr(GGU) m(6)t(6)A37 methyltransferase TsaA
MNGFSVSPVGFVVSAIESMLSPDDFLNTESDIVILSRFEAALEGLKEEGSIIVVFRFHLSSAYSLRVHPRGDESRGLKGVFATCSPRRPNFIGVSHVRLLAISGNRISVSGLDAVNGTPVIDIKPSRPMNRRC